MKHESLAAVPATVRKFAPFEPVVFVDAKRQGKRAVNSSRDQSMTQHQGQRAVNSTR
jgi:hypothetical protein